MTEPTEPIEPTKRVWKFTVPVDDHDHDLPGMAQCLSGVVGVISQQADQVSFWVENVTGHAGPDVRRYRVFGTGHEVPVGYAHRGLAEFGPFVWHLFEYVLPLDETR